MPLHLKMIEDCKALWVVWVIIYWYFLSILEIKIEKYFKHKNTQAHKLSEITSHAKSLENSTVHWWDNKSVKGKYENNIDLTDPSKDLGEPQSSPSHTSRTLA